MKTKKNNNIKISGFTLIELLVVISIIALLSSVVLSSVAVARDKANDSKAVSERHSFQVALQIYRTQNGRYPNPGNTSLHCISNSACTFAGVSYAGGTASTGFSGELAKLVVPNNEAEQDLSFIKKAEAYIGGVLPAALTLNPLIQLSSTYAGPFYQCIDSTCSDVRIIFTTKNAIQGLPGNQSGGSAGLYEQSAEGSAATSIY
ncbi:MAG: prepilin-type N-terminal cleavage/methylation domain-containing protein [bacterium]